MDFFRASSILFLSLPLEPLCLSSLSEAQVFFPIIWSHSGPTSVCQTSQVQWAQCPVPIFSSKILQFWCKWGKAAPLPAQLGSEGWGAWKTNKRSWTSLPSDVYTSVPTQLKNPFILLQSNKNLQLWKKPYGSKILNLRNLSKKANYLGKIII